MRIKYSVKMGIGGFAGLGGNNVTIDADSDLKPGDDMHAAHIMADVLAVNVGYLLNEIRGEGHGGDDGDDEDAPEPDPEDHGEALHVPAEFLESVDR